ncbi:hypothetical protein LshimejAT787_1103100 [Lyophyllum shimeji]|uniref:Uncharacterized protein n=1 Tax=Lyophyllum shimeji TaxID=47721 RepID=A0A9P3USC2_LYOSH|nr:hypothetical protein LshimejAT787_1103100 [Lyophyllum shimeji]
MALELADVKSADETAKSKAEIRATMQAGTRSFIPGYDSVLDVESRRRQSSNRSDRNNMYHTTTIIKSEK